MAVRFVLRENKQGPYADEVQPVPEKG
jgi:hypothetical protein